MVGKMRKVLVITYYWPPSAGAGVQRWLKFCKYLRRFGWEPVIFTPLNPEYPGHDPSLEKDIPRGLEVIQRRIWEPYQMYRLVTGRSRDEKVQAGFLSESRKPGRLESLSVWLRGNLFIPDARKWWVKPSIRFLKGWLQKNPVDAMVSTGPPHSMHLIALGIRREMVIPWLADFRDPWTQIDFYHHLKLTTRADKKHKALERQVLTEADAVTTVSPHCAKGLRDIVERNVEVLTNGYDPVDFVSLPDFNYDAFSITHLGSMNADRNPHALWKVLGKLVRENDFFRKNLEIRLIGKTDISVMESLEKEGLTSFTKNLNYLPHDQAVARAGQSAVLLLPLNNTPNVLGIAPGKLYEYLALQRPILCIGPTEGDAASIIKETMSGHTSPFDDESRMQELLLYWANKYEQKELIPNASAIENYSREKLTGRLSFLLDRMTE
jgi:glycosyltransferase involved in cell wall biosynthesis